MTNLFSGGAMSLDNLWKIFVLATTLFLSSQMSLEFAIHKQWTLLKLANSFLDFWPRVLSEILILVTLYRALPSKSNISLTGTLSQTKNNNFILKSPHFSQEATWCASGYLLILLIKAYYSFLFSWNTASKGCLVTLFSTLLASPICIPRKALLLFLAMHLGKVWFDWPNLVLQQNLQSYLLFWSAPF